MDWKGWIWKARKYYNIRLVSLLSAMNRTMGSARTNHTKLGVSSPAVQLQRPFSLEHLAPFLQLHFWAQSSPNVPSGHSSMQSVPRNPVVTETYFKFSNHVQLTKNYTPTQSTNTTAYHWTQSNSTIFSHMLKSPAIFTNQKFIHIPLSSISIACHTHLANLDSNHPTNVRWAVQIMKHYNA
jgi:hypothetical protein